MSDPTIESAPNIIFQNYLRKNIYFITYSIFKKNEQYF